MVVGTAVGDGVVGSGADVITTDALVGDTAGTRVRDVALTVVVTVTVADDTALVTDAATAVVSGTSFATSGNEFSALPAEPSVPVDTPSRNRAAMAAPRIAPSANRPCPPRSAATPCTYRLSKLPSSGSAQKSEVDHISTSACSARTFCHVSSSAGVYVVSLISERRPNQRCV